MRIASLLAVAALAASSHASSAGLAAPTGLHGFLLRADETSSSTFHRTPSFAWNPVAGATRYQFQLATTNTFRDNGILYDNTLQTPVEAPPLTLPWITGSPHSLYARVRALFASDATPWSAPFGFDVVPPATPTPLPSYPGLLRWTPVEGADGYQVWLVDTGKIESVRSNVLDERDFYTFHQAQNWIGSVRWRIRAVRGDTATTRINGIPVSHYGAWSPVYGSSNPAPSGGPITLIGTLSDVFSDGSPDAPAQRLMPGFLWSGNQTEAGTSAELFRVYVFTDRQCLNAVFTSPVVGSPAYAPRPLGTLAIPQDAAALSAARSGYLPDGSEAGGVSYDGAPVSPTEQLPDASPTMLVPGEVPNATGSGSGSSGSGGAGSGSSGIAISGRIGAPVDLWDTSWPESGYYWTVVPVSASALGAAATSVAAPGASVGSALVPVADSTSFKVGLTVTIGTAPSSDTASIVSISGNSITLSTPLKFGHAAGEGVVANGSSITYKDLELPQDVCAAGRVQRFGIESEPSLTTAQAPFATGLSSTGRLTSAEDTSSFYGQPLVAWTPALGAGAYQVQWSKTRYPFVAELDPRTNTKGFLTFSTSSVLPLRPGTWWYRVRGFDYNLPTGVQQMSWSDPERLVVSAPKFKVVATPQKKGTFKVVKPARTTVVLKLRPAATKGTVDVDNPPTGRSKGDRVVITDQLVNVVAQLGKIAGVSVGSDRLTLSFTSADAADVKGVATLPGGTITFAGHTSLTDAMITLTVDGGTGAFAQARGTFTQSQTGSPVDTFTLSVPR